MARITDVIIVEIADSYRSMPLIELLAEENMMTTFLQRKRPNPLCSKLHEIICSEIEKKLK